MQLTQGIIEFMEDPRECITLKHIEDYQDKVSSSVCIESLLSDENMHCITFKYGFLIFEIKNALCYIYVYYRAENSEGSAKDAWNMFMDFLKINGVNTVRMETQINPDFWIKNYGFNLSSHLMEKRI